jgi:hypothetical protein
VITEKRNMHGTHEDRAKLRQNCGNWPSYTSELMVRPGEGGRISLLDLEQSHLRHLMWGPIEFMGDPAKVTEVSSNEGVKCGAD